MSPYARAMLMPLPVLGALLVFAYTFRDADKVLFAGVVILVSILSFMLLSALVHDLQDQKRMRQRAADEASFTISAASAYRGRVPVIDAQCEVVKTLADRHLSGRCRYRRLSEEIDLLRDMITENSR